MKTKKPQYLYIYDTKSPHRATKSKRARALHKKPPLLVSVADAMHLVSYGRTKVFSMLNDGTLKRVKSGKSTRITMESIKAFVGASDVGS